MKTSQPRKRNATPKAAPQPEPPPVRFEFTHPTARSVCIAGTFNAWHPSVTEMIALGDGRWVKELALPPGTHEYRLVVDGEWMADPTAGISVANPYGGQNSVVIVPPVS